MKKEPKQVIVMRSDLKMRKGKMMAQAAHAAMIFLSRKVIDSRQPQLETKEEKVLTKAFEFHNSSIPLSDAELDWLENKFTKIALRVDSEEELNRIYEEAKSAGLTVEKVIDSGATEFHGEPTFTCIAIGPDYPERIDPITRELKLW